MNKLHYHQNKNSLIKSYYIALSLLLVFSIYKNGILLYQNNLINFKNIFIPLYFYLISIIISIIVSFIYKEKYPENILISLILASTISINTNYFIYPILLFVVLFIFKYLKLKTKFVFNDLSIMHLLLLLSLLINSYSYLNIGEKLNKFNYSLFDIFIGKGVSSLATSSLLLVIIAFIILCVNKFYKKEIAISSSISFILLSLLYILIFKNNNYLNILLNGTVYFSFVFIAPHIYVSPFTNKGKIIYGLLIGILTFILTLLLNYIEASFISIFIISLFIPLIDKLTIRKNS